MLDKVKLALRLTTASFDAEVDALIAAARIDLSLSGVDPEKASRDDDPLITRAIVTYTKANFGWDNPDAERLQRAYELLKSHLTLAGDYRAVQ